MYRAILSLLAALALALPGCRAALQSGEAWYTYRNEQNSFAVATIDGRAAGPRLRPGDEGVYPLPVSTPHTVSVAHGQYKPVIGLDYHREELEADTIDPLFTIWWVEASGWTEVHP